MYVLLTVTEENYSFQQKDEAGNNIGLPAYYPTATYKLVLPIPNVLSVLPLDAPDNTFPPKAAYPIEKVIIVNDTTV